MLTIGSGAGFSGDRIEPAVELAEKIDLDYLVFECLAERTIAKAQQLKMESDNQGYDPLLEERMEAILPLMQKKNFRIISNMGAANPKAAGEKVIEIARRLDIRCSVAIVTGDDVIPLLEDDKDIYETEEKVIDYKDRILSANAYLGIDAILPALETGADVILTGRAADPSLFLAPMVHHFKWDRNGKGLLGQGTLIGHLLECAGQITGGYFLDSEKKEIPHFAHIGFPFAEIESDGTAVISKAPGTGGVVNSRTVKEQILYEVHNPASYLTPDVEADFSEVRVEEVGKDKVRISGGQGSVKPPTYKVSIGYQAGYIGEGEISYAGARAVDRAEQAAEIVKERIGGKQDIHTDFIGVGAVHRIHQKEMPPYEVRLRLAAMFPTKEEAQMIGREVESLYTNGPFGGGGARSYARECIGIVSTFLERIRVDDLVQIEVYKND